MPSFIHPEKEEKLGQMERGRSAVLSSGQSHGQAQGASAGTDLNALHPFPLS